MLTQHRSNRSMVGNKCSGRINREIIGTATSVTIQHSYNSYKINCNRPVGVVVPDVDDGVVPTAAGGTVGAVVVAGGTVHVKQVR